jgi:CheY-like chemotaxis protein
MGQAPVILAVEDEPVNVALLRAILSRRPYVLVAAETIAAARAWLADHRPDMILLDRHLPDGDGLDLARQLRATAETRSIPILLVTAGVLPADRAAAEEAGCDGFVAKPISMSGLLGEMESLLHPRLTEAVGAGEA